MNFNDPVALMALQEKDVRFLLSLKTINRLCAGFKEHLDKVGDPDQENFIRPDKMIVIGRSFVESVLFVDILFEEHMHVMLDDTITKWQIDRKVWYSVMEDFKAFTKTVS